MFHMKRKMTTTVAILVLLSACSSDEAVVPAESSVVDTTVVSPTTTATTIAVVAPSDLVEVASTTAGFSTLVSALTAADLVATLQGEGPFTVFAPSDDAFAALPSTLLTKLLLPENKDVLVSILTYHVVAGKVTSQQIRAGEVTTVEGSPISIGTSGGLLVNDATVVLADVEASNGVIHVIDRVLVPPTVDLSGL